MGRRARANLMVLGFDDALWRSVISECRFHNLPSPCTTEFAALSKLHQVSATTAWTSHSITHSHMASFADRRQESWLYTRRVES